MTANDQNALWQRRAGTWQKLGPPFRPSADDGRLILAAAEPALLQRPGPADIAILGVTPELVQLAWPAHVTLRAFDCSAGMIETLWQPSRHLPSTVEQAFWQRLPIPDRSIRVAVGDASLNAVRGADFSAVLSELARVLEPDGRLCLRCFICPDQPESLDTIAADAIAGRIGGFDALRLRIAMSLSEAPGFAVPVSRIFTAFQSMFPDRHGFSRMTGWPLDILDAINAYDGAQTEITLPTLDGIVDLCAEYFDVETVAHADYQLAERCPTLRLRPLRASSAHD